MVERDTGTRGITRVFECLRLHLVPRGQLLRRVALAAVRDGASCESGSVDLRLEVPLEHVPVADTHHSRPDREDHRNEQREKNDDLSPFLVGSRAIDLRQHVGPVPPVWSFGTCSSLIVAFAVRVIPTLFMKKNLYGAVSLTCTGSPFVGVPEIPG